jgi:hypothetical protein
MQLLCKEKNQIVDLKKLYEQSENIVITVDPFVGDLHYKLLWNAPPPSNYLAFFLEEQERYTKPVSCFSWKGIPAHTYILLIKDNEYYYCFMTLSHKDLLSKVQGTDKGLYLNLHSGSTHEANLTRPVLVSNREHSPYLALEKTLEQALKYTGSRGKLLTDKAPLPNWMNYLGWSTRLLNTSYTHNCVIHSLKNLLKQSIPIQFVLLEEGWQALSPVQRGSKQGIALAHFDADSQNFPKGLATLIKEIKAMGIPHVGITHHAMGAYGGIDIQLARKYDLPPDNFGRYFLGYDLGKTFEFFHDYYTYLRQQGVSFINISQQNYIHQYYRDGIDITRLFKHIQTAIQAAASIHFDNAHINQQCLRNENLFYWNSARLVQPAEPINYKSTHGCTRYIRQHLSNSLWTQHLMQNQVDIWISNHEHTETLGIFHALSGAPSILADTMTHVNKPVLKRFVLPSGKLLNADHSLTLCSESLFCNPEQEKSVYKAYTYINKNGLLGLFNLFNSKRCIQESISPSNIPKIEGDLFAIYSFRNGFLGTCGYNETIEIKLKPYSSDIISFSPVISGVALIGYHRLFIPYSPIIEYQHLEDAFHFQSLITSPMLLYCEKEILEISCNGKVVPWDYESENKILKIHSKRSMSEELSLYSLLFEE